MGVEQILQQVFGYDSFRGRQAEAIERVVSGEHVLLIMPTGMGKSLCFQIPALNLPAKSDDGRANLCVVISPLIALMKDQVDGLVSRGVDAVYVNSSLSRQEREARYQGIAEGKYRLLYVTPERFRKAEFRDVLSQRHVPLLAVDEAHCISEWGHDFRPDYSRVGDWRELLGNPVTIAMTATATPDVQADIGRQLRLDGKLHLIHEGINRPNLKLSVEKLMTDEEKYEQIDEVADTPEFSSGSGIVYFTLIKTLERFSAYFASCGRPHLCYHGDLERRERRRVQNQFMQGDCPLVLATNAFGMGIDKEDIRYVVHAEVPGSMESYYQEIGRAGRDGKPSECRLLYDERDLMTQMEFIEWKNPDADYYERVYELLVKDSERIQAFGLEWFNKQLQCRSKHDHRVDTVLSMFDRHGVVAGPQPPACFEVTSELPEHFRDAEFLTEKRLRDQKKLYALVQYAAVEEDRKQFIHEYFGLELPD